MLVLKIIAGIFVIVAFLLLILIFLVPEIIVKYNDSLSDSEVYLKILFVKLRLYPQDENAKIKKKRKKLKKQKRKEARAREREAEKRAALIAKGENTYDGQNRKRKKKASKKELTPYEKARKLAASIRLTAMKVRAAAPYILDSLSLEIKKLYITVATGDAASTAVGYGMVCSAINIFLGLEEDLNHFSCTDNLYVGIDYSSEKTEAEFEISLKIALRKVLLGLYHWEKTSIAGKLGI